MPAVTETVVEVAEPPSPDGSASTTTSVSTTSPSARVVSFCSRLARRPDVFQPLVMLVLFFCFAAGAFFNIAAYHDPSSSERACRFELEKGGCPRQKTAAILLDITEEHCMDECRADAACSGGFFAKGTKKTSTKRTRYPNACYLFDVEGATELACTQPETVNFGPEFRCRTKGCPTCNTSRGRWVAVLVAVAACASFCTGVKHLLRKLYQPVPVRIQQSLERDAWMVRLRPDDVGRSLGIVVEVEEESGMLRVSHVSRNAAVNRAMRMTSMYRQPSRVKVGDILVAVNGCRGPLPELMSAARGENGPVETIIFRRLRKDHELMIASLPVRKIDSKEVVRTCCLCLEDMEQGSDVRTLPCFHYFHASCSHEWLRRENSCPLCRAKSTLSSVTAPVCVPVPPEEAPRRLSGTVVGEAPRRLSAGTVVAVDARTPSVQAAPPGPADAAENV